MYIYNNNNNNNIYLHKLHACDLHRRMLTLCRSDNMKIQMLCEALVGLDTEFIKCNAFILYICRTIEFQAIGI